MSHTLGNNIQHRCLGLILTGLILAAASQVNAALIIRVDDPLTGTDPDILVADGSGDDLFGPSGMVTIADTLTNGQTVSISAASVPLIGTDPKLDLVTLTISGLTNGVLHISATNTHFTLPPSTDTEFLSSIGGTTDGSVTAASYIDASNGEFASTTLLHDFGAFFGPAFSSSATSIVATPISDFSMTLLVDVNHDDPFDVTSFDFVVSAAEPGTGETPVPEPATLTLGAIGLAIFGSYARRSRRARRRSGIR